jgi:hypothetical protein
MSDSRDIGYAAIFFGFGIWSFFKGFKLLNEKRLIENTPTSTVRGLALGLVELTGQAKKTRIFNAPLSGTECLFYRYTVERYQSSGRSGKWVVIAKGDSTYCPFCLDDGTGKIMVFPCDAELIMPVKYQYQTGLGRGLPDNLVNFMESNGLSYRTFLGNYSLRFKEWFILPDEPVYVLGTAEKTNDCLSDHKEKLAIRLERLKGDPKAMAEVDSNKDGTISNEEWDQAVAKVEEKLLDEELTSGAQDEATDVAIRKGDNKQAFIISDEDQAQITKGMTWQIFVGVFGGAALSLVMLAYLLFRLGSWMSF